MPNWFSNWHKAINPDDDINSMFETKQCKDCIHQGDGFYCNECIRINSAAKYDYFNNEED